MTFQKLTFKKTFIGNVHDMTEDIRVHVDGYEYTNKNGKLVKVPPYDYERGSSAKENVLNKAKAIQKKIPVEVKVGEKYLQEVSKTKQTKINESSKKRVMEKVERIKQEKYTTDDLNFIMKLALKYDTNNTYYLKKLIKDKEYPNKILQKINDEEILNKILKLAHKYKLNSGYNARKILQSKLREAWKNYEENPNSRVKYRKYTTIEENLRFIEKLYGYKSTTTVDFIDLSQFTRRTEDFDSQDFTVLHGPITRSGAFEYVQDGKKVVLYKDWKNIKDVFSKLDYIPFKGSVNEGSHHAEEIGFAYNFTPNDETEQMFADVITLEDIDNLTDLKDPESGYHVSIGFEDDVVGDVQYITSVDHLAGSLKNKEIGRCSTAGGTDCTVKIKR